MGDLAEFLAEQDLNFRKARLPALYADFRPQRSLNPDGYRANVAAWYSALCRLASNGQLSLYGCDSSALVICCDESIVRLLASREFGQPLALGAAIRDAISNTKLIPTTSFLHNSNTSKLSSLSWGALKWTLNQFGIRNQGGLDDSIPKGRYVITANLDAACRKFSEAASSAASRFERAFTKAHFRDVFGPKIFMGQHVTGEDIHILLTALARDKELVDYDGKVVRIRGLIDEGGIGDEDTAIASIKELTANLKHQTSVLGCRIKELEQEIKHELGRNNRIAAAAMLRSKKLAEVSLSKRYAALNQLDDVAAKIQQASDQVLLVKAMESSANAMRVLNSQVGSTDRVEDVMDQVREQMEKADEVAAILAESTGEPIDESEIDDELALLEKEGGELANASEAEDMQREAIEATILQSRLEDLPSPPTEDLQSQSEKPSLEKKLANLSI